MKFTPLVIPDFILVEPNVFGEERCIRWDDMKFGITCPIETMPAVLAKDAVGKCLIEAGIFA